MDDVSVLKMFWNIPALLKLKRHWSSQTYNDVSSKYDALCAFSPSDAVLCTLLSFSLLTLTAMLMSTKKISGFKKRIENFIQAKYRIIPQEQPSENFWELSHPLQVIKAQLYKFFEIEGCTLMMLLLTVYPVQICFPWPLRNQVGGFSFKALLVDPGRMFLFGWAGISAGWGGLVHA